MISQYISTQILGTIRTVIYLEYFTTKTKAEQKMRQVKNEIERLSVQKNFSSWVYFYLNEGDIFKIGVFIPQAFDKRRAEKIYSSSTATNRNEFLKKRRVFFRISKLFKGKKSYPKPAIIGKVWEFKSHNYSRPHLDMLKREFGINQYPLKMVGNPKIKYCITEKDG